MPQDAVGSSYSNTRNDYAGDYFNINEHRLISLPEGHWSLLPVIAECDNFTLPSGPWSPARRKLQESDSEPDEETLVPFFLEPPSLSSRKQAQTKPIGFLRPTVLEQLEKDNLKMHEIHCPECWLILREDQLSPAWAASFSGWISHVDEEADSPDDTPFSRRTEHMDRLVRKWREQGLFQECLGGWRDERYSIYGPTSDSNSSPLPGGNVAFLLERAACALFSFATFGVHCTSFYREPGSKEFKIWVPRRSKTKQTFPNMLDNTVAGGITEHDAPIESIIREAEEEASLPATFVEKRIRSGGLICYTRRDADGWIYPEMEYTYDIEFPDSQEVRLKPNDGEVATFQAMSVPEVLDQLLAKAFKPNCALVMVDFFIRHGLLTSESDTRYVDICTRLRSKFDLPVPA